MFAYNLYEHSMMQLLPTEMLDWVNPKDFYLRNHSNNSPLGCLLEVDFDYVHELLGLHGFHNCMICIRNVLGISITNHRR